jgi:hypothetical protein
MLKKKKETLHISFQRNMTTATKAVGDSWVCFDSTLILVMP